MFASLMLLESMQSQLKQTIPNCKGGRRKKNTGEAERLFSIASANSNL